MLQNEVIRIRVNLPEREVSGIEKPFPVTVMHELSTQVLVIPKHYAEYIVALCYATKTSKDSVAFRIDHGKLLLLVSQSELEDPVCVRIDAGYSEPTALIELSLYTGLASEPLVSLGLGFLPTKFLIAFSYGPRQLLKKYI